MSNSIKIAPPNSLLFISDPNGGTTPQITRGQRLWSTPSCIAVGCLSFMDGKTEVTLGAAQVVDPRTRPAFDGMLETPGHVVVVSTVERETILRELVRASFTRVRIWVNHPTEPDKVIIGLG